MSKAVIWVSANIKRGVTRVYFPAKIHLVFKLSTWVIFSQKREIPKSNSQITKPILGMFVLIWMHFSRGIQIWWWNSGILKYLWHFIMSSARYTHLPLGEVFIHIVFKLSVWVSGWHQERHFNLQMLKIRVMSAFPVVDLLLYVK